MGKKLNSLIFILVGTVVDIVLIFAVFALLLTLFYVCRGLIPDEAMQFMLFVAVVGSFAIGVLVYQRLALWVIEKFNLEDKLDPIFKQRPPRR